jgi:hypothetical protein
VLYQPGLTVKQYRAWLDRMGVAYVLLPHDELDASSRQEARLLETEYDRAGLSIAEETPQWTIFKVDHPTPIFRPADDEVLNAITEASK